MTVLSIGQLGYPSHNWFNLNDADLMPGLLGADYRFRLAPGETVQETINLRLHGTAPELRAILNVLEGLASPKTGLARAFPSAPYCLCYWNEVENHFFYSRLLSLSLGSLPAHLPASERGALSLELLIIRENHWESDPVLLTLANTGGGSSTGLTLFNHDDTSPGHDNWCLTTTSSLALVQPSPLKLEITNLIASPDLGDLYVGMFNLMGGGTIPNFTFEAENGSSGTKITSTNASGSAYSQLAWSGNAWTTLTSWTINPTDLTTCANRVLLPILRFFSVPAEANLELRLTLSTNGNLVYQSPSFLMPSAQDYLPLSPFHLPAGVLPLEVEALSHVLTLQARLPGAGAHSLDLDYLLLLPRDGFAHFQSVAGLMQNAILLDDSYLNLTWSRSGSYELATHTRAGSPLNLLPGSETRLYFFQSDGAKLSPITRAIKVKASYRLRRQMP